MYGLPIVVWKGVGAIQLELLKAGAERAVSVELSPLLLKQRVGNRDPRGEGESQ